MRNRTTALCCEVFWKLFLRRIYLPGEGLRIWKGGGDGRRLA